MARPPYRRPLVLMPHDVGGNIFIPEIADGYRDSGYDVVVGRENLTCLACTPDLVHLHWPEEHFYWGGDPRPVEVRAEMFVKRLDELKDRGARIVWQVHNVRPHETRSAALEARVYQAVVDRADLMVHHCEASVDLIKESYAVSPSMRIVVAPLGNYLMYPNTSTRTSARERLGLASDRLIFLHFGAIRAYKGLDLLLEAFSLARVPRKLLLVAGRYVSTTFSESRRDRIALALRKRFARNLRFALEMIPDDEVQYYMNASDVVVLSHRSGLNSAVAVLGMTFGRPVVGPDCGCIETVLKAGDNVTYETGNAAALAHALERAAAMNRTAAGERNRAVAAQWNWCDIATRVVRELGPPDWPSASAYEPTAGYVASGR